MKIKTKIKPVKSLPLVIAALFYGKSGTGKTTVASTFPKPLLHIDIREKGTDSICDVEGIDTIQLDNWDEFEELYWYVKESEYKTVVIDTASQLQDLALDKALGGKSGITTQRTWGVASGMMKTWILNYRDLVDEGINVVFITHDRSTDVGESEDEEMVPTIGPNLMPSVASNLTGSVKIIGNTFIRERFEKEPKLRIVEYCMRIGPHANYLTKIRQPQNSFTPDFIVDPTYDGLVKIMKGEPQRAKPTIKRKIKNG